ncbi:MAG: hypothetical protein HYV61_04590 [Candidatus Rokubacteria bacterium]|nr:hypothetical protein [Candidatus Rokubacteria bacterium]
MAVLKCSGAAAPGRLLDPLEDRVIAGISLGFAGFAFTLFATASLALAGQVEAARGGHVRSHMLKEALP